LDQIAKRFDHILVLIEVHKQHLATGADILNVRAGGCSLAKYLDVLIALLSEFYLTLFQDSVSASASRLRLAL
jgi:hypothetical protein